ncbi:MAG: hypothetical protein ACI84C_000840 [Flavobacteriales bacterium]|jgi:hypothetical protein
MTIEPDLALILKVIIGCALVVFAVGGVLSKQKGEQQNSIRDRSRFNRRKF